MLRHAPQVSDVVAERLVAVGDAAKGMALIERGEVELRNKGELGPRTSPPHLLCYAVELDKK